VPRPSRELSTWIRAEAKAAPPAAYGAGWGGGSWFSDAFRSRRAPTPHELVDAYKSLVYACVNLNANAVARTPLRLYAITRGGQARPKCATKAVPRAAKYRLARLPYATKAMAGAQEVEEVTDHPLLEAVTKVNPELDFIQLLLYTSMSLDITGNAYWWPSIGAYGLPEEVWALPPHLVYPVFTSGNLVPDCYQFGGRDYPRAELIRFRRLSARNPYGQGYGPEQAAIEYARLEDTFVSMQDNALSNGPRPSVVISHKDPQGAFGPAERMRLDHSVNAKARAGNAGRALIVDGAVDVKTIPNEKVDTGVRDISDYDMERIANCLDVPVSMLKTDDVNRANAEAGLEQHGRNAVEPRCKLIASALTRYTHSLDARGTRGLSRLFWAFDPAVNADRAAEAEQHKAYFAFGLTPNTILTEAGYDGIGPAGDVSLVANSLVPLERAVKPPEPVPAALAADAGGETPDDEGEGPEDPAEEEHEADADGAKGLEVLAREVLGEVKARLDAGRPPAWESDRP
jgi:phage portal protein BeeE